MRRVVVVVATGFALASCGGSATTDTAAPETTAEVITTEAPTTTEASTTTAKQAIGSEVDVDRYCELSRASSEASDDLLAHFDVVTPEELEAFMAGQEAALEEAVEIAEPEIKDALRQSLAEALAFDTVLAEYDYDFTAAGPDIAVLETDEESSDLLERYDFETCGIPIGTDPEGGDSGENGMSGSSDGSDEFTAEELSEAEFIVDQINSDPEFRESFLEGFMNELPNLSQEKAECFADNLDPVGAAAFLKMGEMDPSDIDLSSDGMLAFFGMLSTCDISLAELN